MSTKEVLIAARKLIEKPENWTQGKYARNRDGTFVRPEDQAAACFCMIGACARAAGLSIRQVEEYELGGVLSALARVTKLPIHTFNDSHSHAEVLEAFDKAIAECA